MDIDPELVSDEFWEGAFQRDDPFQEELKTEFRRGVVTGNEEDLRWGRMAMASISDDALWPLLSRLMELAIGLPGAEFVESLVFFLSDENTLRRLSSGIARLPSVERAQHLDNLASTLSQIFIARSESDLAQDLEPFRTLLRGITIADGERP